MFEYLNAARKEAAVQFSHGTVASLVVHGALVAALVVDGVRHAVLESAGLDEVIEGMMYIAPPDVHSVASQVQVRYEATGGAEGEADPKDAKEGPGQRARGTGGGESAIASVSGGDDIPDQFALATEDPYENAFSSVEVEQAAERDPASAAPVYPTDLMARGVEGYAAMRFVVDSTGLVDLSTVRVLETTHPEFAAAVRSAMPGMRFAPARLGERPVRQLAEQMFAFKIERTTPVNGPATASSGSAPRRPEPPR